MQKRIAIVLGILVYVAAHFYAIVAICRLSPHPEQSFYFAVSISIFAIPLSFIVEVASVWLVFASFRWIITGEKYLGLFDTLERAHRGMMMKRVGNVGKAMHIDDPDYLEAMREVEDMLREPNPSFKSLVNK